MDNPRILLWYRKDLRINDNKALTKALSISKAITSIYIFDKNNNDYQAKARSWFLGNSLKELSKKWEKANSRLIIKKGSTITLIPKIAHLIEAKYVIWNKSIEPYEIKRDEEIKKNLLKCNINVIDLWDHLLLTPFQVFTGSNRPYTVYGPFFKNFKSQLNNASFNEDIKSLDFYKLKDLTVEFKDNVDFSNSDQILEDFQESNIFNGQNICPCKPGEIAAEQLLSDFISTKKINSYKLYRDYPSTNGTSYLSASLKFGTISIRRVWREASNLALTKINNEDLLSIETWQKEIAWREFYQHCLFHFPELEKGPYRKKWNAFPWQNNEKWFNRWASGETGVPIIDAAMRQLNQSGWMHNRCRMIVASFLVKDLICNWQMGEKKFMELLVDGDLAANNGGWQWSASSGMDPKPLRIFNPYTQTKKFDPLCEYIKYWIPELSKVNNKDIVNGEVSDIERKNYPRPIIKHNIQQRLFKTLYAEI